MLVVREISRDRGNKVRRDFHICYKECAYGDICHKGVSHLLYEKNHGVDFLCNKEMGKEGI